MTDRATLASPTTQIVTNYYDAENRWVGRAVDPDGDTGTAAIQLTTFAYAGNQIIFQFDGTAETFPAPLGAEGEGLASSPRPLAGEGAGGEGSQNQAGLSTPLTAQHLSHRYLWADAVDQLLADEQLEATASGYDLSSPGNVLLPLTDQLGTVRDLAVCENGVTSVANHRVYDAYGNLLSETNAAVDCVFGFTGRPWDSKTGLQNNWEREYDPLTHSWLSKDPLGFQGHDSNTYRYVGNRVTSATDPSGLADPSQPDNDPFGFRAALRQFADQIKQGARDDLIKLVNDTGWLKVKDNDDGSVTYTRTMGDVLGNTVTATVVQETHDQWSVRSAVVEFEGKLFDGSAYQGNIKYANGHLTGDVYDKDGHWAVSAGSTGVAVCLNQEITNSNLKLNFCGGMVVADHCDITFAGIFDATLNDSEGHAFHAGIGYEGSDWKLAKAQGVFELSFNNLQIFISGDKSPGSRKVTGTIGVTFETPTDSLFRSLFGP